jgi:hypothetical protein
MSVDSAVTDWVVDDEVTIDTVVDRETKAAFDSKQENDTPAQGIDRVRDIRATNGGEGKQMSACSTVDSGVHQQGTDDKGSQSVDTVVDEAVDSALNNSADDGRRENDIKVEGSRPIQSPWDKPFEALTDYEQAMHKLYGKYGAECDERLQRPTFGLCSRYLQKLCPACFGGTVFGKSESQYIPLSIYHT